MKEGEAVEDDDDFIKVVESEGGELIEFPKEDDGTVLLRTIQTQFATAIGLKYKGPSGAWRAIKEGDDAKLVAPKGGWGNIVYCITFSKKEDVSRKRKVEENDSSSTVSKYPKAELLLKDLSVTSIPYEAGHRELKQFFQEKYGGVESLLIKTDKATGRSKGFGFIRFNNEESAKKALDGEAMFMGRRVYVRPKTQKPIKMYVNSLPEGTTRDDLVDYFSQYGDIIDSYVPTPFRNYGFFTFASTEDGFACLRNEQHVLKGKQVMVKIRKDKEADEGKAGSSKGPVAFANPVLGTPVGFNVGGGGTLGGFRGVGGGASGGMVGGPGVLASAGVGGVGLGSGVLGGTMGGAGIASGGFVGRGGLSGVGAPAGVSGGNRGGFNVGRGAHGSGGARNPQMAAELKNMLYQFLTS